MKNQLILEEERNRNQKNVNSYTQPTHQNHFNLQTNEKNNQSQQTVVFNSKGKAMVKLSKMQTPQKNQVGINFINKVLFDKKTGSFQNYKEYKERDLEFLNVEYQSGKTLKNYNMKKLEEEYDYDTDDTQLHRARKLLQTENIHAVQYSATEGDPLLLVSNLKLNERMHEKYHKKH